MVKVLIDVEIVVEEEILNAQLVMVQDITHVGIVTVMVHIVVVNVEVVEI